VSYETSRRRRHRLGAFAGALACVAASATFAAAPARAADTLRNAEWPVSFLDLPAAQQLSSGSGITVALLDTGVVQGRADLTGQVTAGPDFAGGVEQEGEAGWGEHGTCMASIIAGHGRNGGGDGMLGVAPAAHILSVRVIRDDDAPDVGGSTKDATPISDGIKYAVDHGAQVISMSLGGDQQDAGDDSSALSDAIRYALAHNVVVVAAAGNGATEGNAVSYPGGDRGVITVAAVDSNAQRGYFSTTGWDVSVAAPGVNLPCDAFDTDSAYMEGSGTSQATAYVSGVVALIRSENRALTPAQIRGLLEQTANHKPSGGRNDELGFGVIDPVAALQAAKNLGGLKPVPTAGASVTGSHFGYGPAEKVTLASAGLDQRSRALIGGAALVVIGLLAAAVLLRRPKRTVPPPPGLPAPWPGPAPGPGPWPGPGPAPWPGPGPGPQTGVGPGHSAIEQQLDQMRQQLQRPPGPPPPGSGLGSDG
jgi:type VII secretion-associated serine protease mycosin